MHVNMKRDISALILLWKVFKNLMHIIHAYYEQCVFYRYKVCKLLLNILWLGTLWLLYKYYKKTCSREVRLPPYKEVHKCGPGGERGGGGGGWRNGKIPKLVVIEGCMHSGGEKPRPICHYDLTCMGEFYYYNYLYFLLFIISLIIIIMIIITDFPAKFLKFYSYMYSYSYSKPDA